ncbi:hypothetical protein GCM10010435_58970 [Winogradskya consettensis]|uniref:Uncharacterized protein n=1 Tax=Winogradskya consettensis TaxID=113560 RepID=A0A919SMC4_9ACTN|nr:hypothetical protein [Actinoplanes consettensis]GIM74241.1 hypothetical protein Aco04nite_39310 [Actinoplanes consettensis]
MSFFRRSRTPIARTLAEAEIYLQLHPCTCGAIDIPGATHRGDALWYDGACPLCGRPRAEPFGLPLAAPAFGTHFETFYGGPQPSTLIDAGEWLDLRARYASVVPPAPGSAPSVVTRYTERITQATAQVTEYLKFIPGNGRWTTPPRSAYWTDAGREAARKEVTLGRAYKEAYRQAISQDLIEKGGRYRGVRIEGAYPEPS